MRISSLNEIFFGNSLINFFDIYIFPSRWHIDDGTLGILRSGTSVALHMTWKTKFCFEDLVADPAAQLTIGIITVIIWHFNCNAFLPNLLCHKNCQLCLGLVESYIDKFNKYCFIDLTYDHFVETKQYYQVTTRNLQ